MVGNGGTVDASAHYAFTIGEIGCTGIVVRGGQAGLIGQTQVGIFCLRNIVIDLVTIGVVAHIGAVIVCGAVGVKNDDCTVFNGICNTIYGNGRTGIQGITIRITDSGSNGLRFILVLIGKGVINTVVGSDQVDLIAAGPAALGSLGRIIDTGRLRIGRSLHIVILLPHIRIVDAADTLICPPGEGIAVAL